MDTDVGGLLSDMAAGASTPAKSEFKFPILEDPSQIFGVLLGQPADLVTYDMAPLEFDFEWSQFFSHISCLYERKKSK